MKVIAPIRSSEQYEALVGSGAQELYGGLSNPEWGARYGEKIEYNRRGSFGKTANFISMRDLEQVLRWCERDGIPFYLTLNAIFISRSQCDILSELLRSYRQRGGMHVIVGDLQSFQLALQAGCQVTVSSCAGIYHELTARVYSSLGARRLILPRSIQVKDIPAIRRACADSVEIEVFLMNTMCKYSDSICRSLHNTESGALCAFYDHRKKKYRDPDGHEICGREASQMQTDSFFYQQLHTGNCSMGCGLCAVWDLLQAGVASVKVVGRLLKTGMLCSQIAQIREDIELARESGSREEYLAGLEVSGNLPDENICRRGYQCYYRDIRRVGISG